MTVFVFPPAEDEGSESGNFVTNEDPSQKLKWQAHLEFTQNQELGELTWDKVSKLVNVSICYLKQAKQKATYWSSMIKCGGGEEFLRLAKIIFIFRSTSDCFLYTIV